MQSAKNDATKRHEAIRGAVFLYGVGADKVAGTYPAPAGLDEPKG